MTIPHSRAWIPSILVAAAAVAQAGCADVIGADFDVHAACETCPVVLAEDLKSPKAVTVADGFVFWTEWNDPGRVMKVPVAGGDPVVIAEGEHGPNQIAVGGGYVYWTTTLDNGSGLRRAKVTGGPSEDFATGQTTSIGVALDDTTAYWAAQSSQSVRALRFDAAPGEGTALAEKTPYTALVALNGADVFFTQAGDGGGLWKVPKTGGTPTMILPEPYANSIAFLGDVVCVSNYAAGIAPEVVDCVNKDGSGQMRAAKDRDQPAGMVSDGESLFWGEVGLGAIMQGGPLAKPKVVAGEQDSPNGLAIDGENLYWTNFTPHGTVMKMKIP